MDQNLSQYRIFHAVAQTGNISKAARELYISQTLLLTATMMLVLHLQEENL